MQDNQLRPALGPYKVIGSIFCDQCWAHTMPLVEYFWASAGPMQDHRQHIWRPVLGPFKIIGSIFWDQCWAHASPAAASLAPVLGPYKSIGSTYFRWCWAHSRHSIISSGPTLIFYNACLLCQWAHPKALVVGYESYDGPILKIHSHCLHGPMWAFPIYSGSNNCPNVWPFWKDWLGINQVNYKII